MNINSLEKININNSEQWILVRGKAGAPLILHVQAGPGLPMIPEANEMEKLLHLENNYLVAYWDQRGCGKSFNKNIDPKTINFSQLTDDIIDCAKYLLKKYNKENLILMGYSIGATIGLMAATRNSSIFSQLFLTGIDIDIPTANKYAIEFATLKAREKNKSKLIKQVIMLGDKTFIEAKTFQERAEVLSDLGGIKTGSSYNQLLMSAIKNMLFSKAYKLSDVLKTIKGMEFCQNALLPEMDTLNLFDKITAVKIPVHFIQGKLDGIAPYKTAVKFYEYLLADTKSFTAFEHSAHMPQYEEPEKFARLFNEKIK
jgi:proline iminopeptidase